MSQQQQLKNEFPSAQKFCAELALYSGVPVSDKRQDVYNFITSKVNIDFFCTDCAQPSVFIGVGNDLKMLDYEFDLEDRLFTHEFVCSRVHYHRAYFHFRLKKKILTKIGQSPSMADISEAALIPYRKVLDGEAYRELTRAVGLASHGIGVGSFVYLRRIFESLIAQGRMEAAQDTKWDESVFETARMDEKIELLKSQLPRFLVENRKIYSILSKGIHSLTEDECLEAFPVIRMGIELILDDRVATTQRQLKIAEAQKGIQHLHHKLK